MKDNGRISVSFRIPREVLRILEEEAKHRDLSLSAVVIKLLTKGAIFDLFIENIHPITIARETFLAIINYVTEDELQHAGELGGSRVPKSFFKQHNLKPTLNSLLREYFGRLEKYAGRFTAKQVPEEQKIILHHSLGMKWSCFLKGHITATFRSILKMEPHIDMDESSVTIYLKQ